MMLRLIALGFYELRRKGGLSEARASVLLKRVTRTFRFPHSCSGIPQSRILQNSDCSCPTTCV